MEKENPNKPQNMAVHHLLKATKSFPEQPATGFSSLWNLRETIGILGKSLKAGANIKHSSSGPSESHPSGLQLYCSRGT